MEMLSLLYKCLAPFSMLDEAILEAGEVEKLTGPQIIAPFFLLVILELNKNK